MLWDSIYEFFIRHVFGGNLADGTRIYATLGQVYYSGSETYVGMSTRAWDIDILGMQYSFGNYFSLIATIITLVIIVTLCALFIWKMVKLIGGLIR